MFRLTGKVSGGRRTDSGGKKGEAGRKQKPAWSESQLVCLSALWKGGKGLDQRFPILLMSRVHTSVPFAPFVMMTMPEPVAGLNWQKHRKPDWLDPL
jgi:hypothetical protein